MAESASITTIIQMVDLAGSTHLAGYARDVLSARSMALESIEACADSDCIWNRKECEGTSEKIRDDGSGGGSCEAIEEAGEEEEEEEELL